MIIAPVSCRCDGWFPVRVTFSYYVRGVWCPDLAYTPGSRVGGQLVARFCHIWCCLHILERVVAGISKGVSADQKAAREVGKKLRKRTSKLLNMTKLFAPMDTANSEQAPRDSIFLRKKAHCITQINT